MYYNFSYSFYFSISIYIFLKNSKSLVYSFERHAVFRPWWTNFFGYSIEHDGEPKLADHSAWLLIGLSQRGLLPFSPQHPEIICTSKPNYCICLDEKLPKFMRSCWPCNMRMFGRAKPSAELSFVEFGSWKVRWWSFNDTWELPSCRADTYTR